MKCVLLRRKTAIPEDVPISATPGATSNYRARTTWHGCLAQVRITGGTRVPR
jgi:hypothetical protein